MFAPTAEGGFNCAFCHGDKGVGGAAPYTITERPRRFRRAGRRGRRPALNTVLLRYSRAEVTYILTYGRPFSPMPAWGVLGGGPLNAQQIQNLVDYLQSIQITPKQSQAEVKKELAKAMKEKDPTCVETSRPRPRPSCREPGQGLRRHDGRHVSCPNAWKTEGEALFNLGYYDGFAGGAYSCGRCHTQGLVLREKTKDGSGAFGPPLTNETNQFPGAVLGAENQTDFVCLGSEQGKLYGVERSGHGPHAGLLRHPRGESRQPTSGEVGVNARSRPARRSRAR